MRRLFGGGAYSRAALLRVNTVGGSFYAAHFDNFVCQRNRVLTIGGGGGGGLDVVRFPEAEGLA